MLLGVNRERDEHALGPEEHEHQGEHDGDHEERYSTAPLTLVLGGVVLLFSLLAVWRVLRSTRTEEDARGKAGRRLRRVLVVGLLLSDFTIALGSIGPAAMIYRGLVLTGSQCTASGMTLALGLWWQYAFSLLVALTTYLSLRHPLSSLKRKLDTYPLLIVAAVVLVGAAQAAVWRIKEGYDGCHGFCFYGRPNELGAELMQFVPRIVTSVGIAAVYVPLIGFLRAPQIGDAYVTSGTSGGENGRVGEGRSREATPASVRGVGDGEEDEEAPWEKLVLPSYQWSDKPIKQHAGWTGKHHMRSKSQPKCMPFGHLGVEMDRHERASSSPGSTNTTVAIAGHTSGGGAGRFKGPNGTLQAALGAGDSLQPLAAAHLAGNGVEGLRFTLMTSLVHGSAAISGGEGGWGGERGKSTFTPATTSFDPSTYPPKPSTPLYETHADSQALPLPPPLKHQQSFRPSTAPATLTPFAQPGSLSATSLAPLAPPRAAFHSHSHKPASSISSLATLHHAHEPPYPKRTPNSEVSEARVDFMDMLAYAPPTPDRFARSSRSRSSTLVDRAVMSVSASFGMSASMSMSASASTAGLTTGLAGLAKSRSRGASPEGDHQAGTVPKSEIENQETMASFMRRRTRAYLLWFPFTHLVICVITIIRFTYTAVTQADNPTVDVLTLIVVMGQGLADIVIFGLVEHRTRQQYKRELAICQSPPPELLPRNHNEGSESQ